MVALKCAGCVLTHAPVVPLRSEQAVDEDDGSIFRGSLLSRLEEVVCDFDAAVELGGGERTRHIQPVWLLGTQKSSSSCEHIGERVAGSVAENERRVICLLLLRRLS
jgi:hypothetical protein